MQTETVGRDSGGEGGGTKGQKEREGGRIKGQKERNGKDRDRQT